MLLQLGTHECLTPLAPHPNSFPFPPSEVYTGTGPMRTQVRLYHELSQHSALARLIHLATHRRGDMWSHSVNFKALWSCLSLLEARFVFYNLAHWFHNCSTQAAWRAVEGWSRNARYSLQHILWWISSLSHFTAQESRLGDVRRLPEITASGQPSRIQTQVFPS